MKCSVLLLLAALTCAATTVILAQDEKDVSQSFIVECVFTGMEAEIVERQTTVIKEAIATDIPIRRTVKQEGVGLSWTSLRLSVPSPSLMARVDPDAVTETIPIGPKLTCRIQRASSGILLLDATVADTVSKKHNVREGTLIAATAQLRSVEPVRIGQTVTLSWPSNENAKVAGQVTITIISAK